MIKVIYSNITVLKEVSYRLSDIHDSMMYRCVALTFTVCSKIIGLPKFLPWDPMVNKSCNIERCSNKMHQVVANMILSKYLQVKLNLLQGQLYQVT